MLRVLRSHSCFGGVGGRRCLCGLVVPDPRRWQVCRQPHARQGGLRSQILLGMKMWQFQLAEGSFFRK